MKTFIKKRLWFFGLTILMTAARWPSSSLAGPAAGSCMIAVAVVSQKSALDDFGDEEEEPLDDEPKPRGAPAEADDTPAAEQQPPKKEE